MSYFLLTSKNTLPEQFQAEIPVTEKAKIAEKLIVESFVTQSNFAEAMALYANIPVIGSIRTVDGYTVTNLICLDSEANAVALKDLFINQRNKNAAQIGRAWTHPADPNQYVITEITEDQWFQLLAEKASSAVIIGEPGFNPA